MDIYVGNLSYDTTDEDLSEEFSKYGEVTSAGIVKDKMTGRSRGFAFVTMPEKNDAQAAIEALNGQELQGRALTVNEARPRTERSGSGRDSGGGGRGTRGGGYGGGNYR